MEHGPENKNVYAVTIINVVWVRYEEINGGYGAATLRRPELPKPQELLRTFPGQGKTSPSLRGITSLDVARMPLGNSAYDGQAEAKT